MADDASFQLAPALAPPVTATGRRRLTREDLFAMMRAGVIEEGERTELIDGELFPMASEGFDHDDGATDLLDALRAALGGRFLIDSRGPLNILDATQVAPDLSVWPLGVRGRDKFANNVLLVVEISNTTSRKDLGRKALLYAAAGVPEYWVFDVAERRMWVHRGPEPDGWRERFLLTTPRIAPLCAPEAAVDVTELTTPARS